MAISSQGYRGLDITADGMISSPRIPRYRAQAGLHRNDHILASLAALWTLTTFGTSPVRCSSVEAPTARCDSRGCAQPTHTFDLMPKERVVYLRPACCRSVTLRPAQLGDRTSGKCRGSSLTFLPSVPICSLGAACRAIPAGLPVFLALINSELHPFPLRAFDSER